MIKDIIFPKGSFRRHIARTLRSHPLLGWLAITRSVLASIKLTGKIWPVRCFIYPHINLNIKTTSTSNITMKGTLTVRPWGGEKGASYLEVGPSGCLEINGDFEIGQGIIIIIGRGAKLQIAGRQSESASGITSNTKIMVEESMFIGRDCIISWDCFLTDSDWHDTFHFNNKNKRSSPVVIGDHVWIGHGASILKGTVIEEGCIVASKATTINSKFNSNTLIAGTPARQIKNNVSWER